MRFFKEKFTIKQEVSMVRKVLNFVDTVLHAIALGVMCAGCALAVVTIVFGG